ncbi:MAG: hypothetical protein ACD_9C00301G0006 [uncultured bacterium]|nr:MAG: hypothetical protein ACD_9C00301G0006 [uncultured bacterium]
MLSENLKKNISQDDAQYSLLSFDSFDLPIYDPKSHYKDITSSGHFHALIILRHHFKCVSDYYFSEEQGAKNIDLFMITPSISSPVGPGSDSEAIPIKFGKLDSFLVDSSQFGFEPVVMNKFEKVYCYLPSMRGEDYDKRHLNQFFHCEAEIRGDINKLIPIVEDYIKILCEMLLMMPNIIDKISLNPNKTKGALEKVVTSDGFGCITFDEAVDILVRNDKAEFVNFTESGRDISASGELEIAKLLNMETPFWITNFDRDRVPFYQKPDPNNSEKVINADLIFPSLIRGAFGGEIVGCGQRQDNKMEMLESLERQGISPLSYEWYINLRDMSDYSVTSGFGLGVERFITWSLCRDDIKDAILYPRLKNVITYP